MSAYVRWRKSTTHDPTVESDYGKIAGVHTYYEVLAVFWITLGALWLRRAWIGVKAPLLMTLFQSKGERDTSRVRLGNALLGIAGIIIGLVYLLGPLFKHGPLR